MNKDTLNTLFVGIDVSSKTNAVYAINFEGKVLLNFSVPNDLPGAELMLERLVFALQDNQLQFVKIIIESTSVYSFHIANFLASNNSLFEFNSQVFVINPKTSSNFRKTYVDMDKTDPKDAFVLADLARCGRINQQPYKASQLFALQRLTRQRFHLVKTISAEKAYMLTNIYLKFSSLTTANKEDKPFSDLFGTTSSNLIMDYSPSDIVNMSEDDMINYIVEKGKGRFSKPEENVKLMRKIARDSYRLDELAYDPINVSISSSFNTIKALENNLKVIDKAIERNIKGLCENEYKILLSIPGIGPVYAAGIIAEIGSIKFFKTNNELAKYAGLTWRKTQSGNYEADTTRMTKTGNKYLRYYFIEAVDSVKTQIPEYKQFYTRKYNEVTKTPHKRALALTARKLVRLVFGLLHHNQLYTDEKSSNS